MSDGVAVLIAVLIIAAVAMIAVLLRTRRVVATPTERAVHSTLNTASRAARPLRRGLTTESAQQALAPLRTLTATDAIALYDADGTRLAHDEPHTWDERLLGRADDIARGVTGTAEAAGFELSESYTYRQHLDLRGR